jgi:hypothetical protein
MRPERIIAATYVGIIASVVAFLVGKLAGWI